MANQSYIYLGLAGETGAGRVVHSGLFRLADGSEDWEPLQQGLPEMPAVRALAVHPERPEILVLCDVSPGAACQARTPASPRRTSMTHGFSTEKLITQ